MPHKFWLRRGLGFLNRAEMPPTQRTYAWFAPQNVIWALFSSLLVLGRSRGTDRDKEIMSGIFLP